MHVLHWVDRDGPAALAEKARCMGSVLDRGCAEDLAKEFKVTEQRQMKKSEVKEAAQFERQRAREQKASLRLDAKAQREKRTQEKVAAKHAAKAMKLIARPPTKWGRCCLPGCGRALCLRVPRQGGPAFLGCGKYPACDFTCDVPLQLQGQLPKITRAKVLVPF